MRAPRPGLLLLLAVFSLALARPATAQTPLAREETAAVVDALTAGAGHALPTLDLATIQPALRAWSGEKRAAAQEALYKAAIAYAAAQHGQRMRPSAIDANWALAPQPFDVAAEFESARAARALPQWLAALPPPSAGYRNLVDAYLRYLGFAAAGGWDILESGTLRAGDQTPAVGNLRQRLQAEGYTPSRDGADLFDPTLEAALIEFQRRNGLTEDGVLGPGTLAALNMPLSTRLDTIAANLERWRWLPRYMPARRIEVNIADQTLNYFDADLPRATMRVIVGTQAHVTPMFSAMIEGVVFNPSWTVPAWIAAQEILPRAASDPTYLARNGYSQNGGTLVQAPGAANALGQVKFDMPNSFGVYLHDTPAKSLFAFTDRRLSHGCVRLEAPRELAALVLAETAWSDAAIDQAIATGRTQRIALSAPLPVFFLYWTASTDLSGALHFTRDVYGWDSALIQALRTRITSAAARTDFCAVE